MLIGSINYPSEYRLDNSFNMCSKWDRRNKRKQIFTNSTIDLLIIKLTRREYNAMENISIAVRLSSFCVSKQHNHFYNSQGHLFTRYEA